MSDIALCIEDKASTYYLADFRRLACNHVFVGVILMTLIYLQLDSVNPEIIAVFLIYDYGILSIIATMHLMSKFVSLYDSTDSKFSLVSHP